MKRIITTLILTAFLSPAFAGDTQIDGIKVVSTSAKPGVGNSVHMGGKPVPLSGKPVVEGEQFPQVELVDLNGESVKMGAKDGKVKLISIVPNLMTKVCEAQTHDLSEQSQTIEGKVEMITVSMDTIDIQNKFSSEAKINNVQFLSDKAKGQFGENTGLLLSTDRFTLLARAIIVVDGDNTVRYVQVMDEITTMPDMDKAREVAASLL
jgi:thiol peroxidase